VYLATVMCTLARAPWGREPRFPYWMSKESR